MAPKEGAIAWVDGWALVQPARKSSRPMRGCSTSTRPRDRRSMAEHSGYNPVVKGADALLSAKAKAIFNASYPGRRAAKAVAAAGGADLVRRSAHRVCREVPGRLRSCRRKSVTPASSGGRGSRKPSPSGEGLGEGRAAMTRRHRTRPRHCPLRRFHRRRRRQPAHRAGRVLLASSAPRAAARPRSCAPFPASSSRPRARCASAARTCAASARTSGRPR